MVRVEPQPEPPAQPRPERGAGADREHGKEHACLLRLGAGRRTKILPTVPRGIRQARSEEHTYELQSLMRNSYAVFCLKKKNTITNYNDQCPHSSAIPSRQENKQI